MLLPCQFHHVLFFIQGNLSDLVVYHLCGGQQFEPPHLAQESGHPDLKFWRDNIISDADRRVI